MEKHDTHNHHHGHGHHHDHSHSYKNIKVAAALNITFTIIEFIGGALTNSLSITMSALHDLGDSLVLVSSLKIEKLSHKKPDWEKTFGYRRLSLLSAFLNATILLGGSVWVLSHVIKNIVNPEPVAALGMIGVALVGVAINIAGALRLKHGGTVNEKILSWHFIEDTLGWVGVLLTAIAIHFTGWYVLDPLLTILFTIIVLFGVWRNSKELFNVFLEGAPSEKSLAAIVREIEEVPHVSYVFDIHVWSLDGGHHIASIKAISDATDAHLRETVSGGIKEVLARHKITHSTVEIEQKVTPGEQEQDFLMKE